MSVIGVKVEENTITLIADTQITQGWMQYTEIGQKILITPSAVVAFAGNSCYALIIKDIMSRRPMASHSDAEVLRIIDEIRESMAERGMVYTSDEQNAITMLIATQDRVTAVHGYTIFNVTDATAIGSGAEVCQALLTAGVSLFKAIQIVCERNIYCSPPYEVIEINRDTGMIVGDVLDDTRKPIMESFEAQIAYAEPQSEEKEDDFIETTPEFEIVIEKDDTLRHVDNEPIIF